MLQMAKSWGVVEKYRMRDHNDNGRDGSATQEGPRVADYQCPTVSVIYHMDIYAADSSDSISSLRYICTIYGYFFSILELPRAAHLHL